MDSIAPDIVHQGASADIIEVVAAALRSHNIEPIDRRHRRRGS